MRKRAIVNKATTDDMNDNQVLGKVKSRYLRAYDPPSIEVQTLRLVTLGGSLGNGDSGDPANFRPAGT